MGCLKLRHQRVTGKYQSNTLNWSLPATQAWNVRPLCPHSEVPKACLLHALTTSLSFYIPLQPSTHPLFWPHPLFIQPPPHFGPSQECHNKSIPIVVSCLACPHHSRSNCHNGGRRELPTRVKGPQWSINSMDATRWSREETRTWT